MAELKNYMEEAVFQVLGRMLAEREGVCGCDRCRLDIAALALNQVKPRYVVTDLGEVFTRASQMEAQFGTDVLTAVLRAMEQVGKNPRHSEESS